MTREELDALWFQAMRQSIEAGEDFIRYHFAALVAAAEREVCARMVDHILKEGGGTYGKAIRARGEA